jgi:hypothetical protein
VGVLVGWGVGVWIAVGVVVGEGLRVELAVGMYVAVGSGWADIARQAKETSKSKMAGAQIAYLEWRGRKDNLISGILDVRCGLHKPHLIS